MDRDTLPKGPKCRPPEEPTAPVGMPSAAPKRKRLNAAEKRERRAAGWQLFIKLIGRKAQRGVEPNDRKHNKKADVHLRRMRPEDFDRLIRYGEED